MPARKIKLMPAHKILTTSALTAAATLLIGYHQPPALSVMGQCSSTRHLACGVGYDTVSGLGSPGRAFFTSFGSHPK
jgi:hypothetical protein